MRRRMATLFLFQYGNDWIWGRFMNRPKSKIEWINIVMNIQYFDQRTQGCNKKSYPYRYFRPWFQSPRAFMTPNSNWRHQTNFISLPSGIFHEIWATRTRITTTTTMTTTTKTTTTATTEKSTQNIEMKDFPSFLAWIPLGYCVKPGWYYSIPAFHAMFIV